MKTRTAEQGLPQAAAGWYADPSRRHEARYFDGSSWTAWNVDAGRLTEDASGPRSEAVHLVPPETWAPAGGRKPRPGVKVAIIAFGVVAIGFALFAALGLIGIATEMSGGVDPTRQMNDIHAALDHAGIRCTSWAPSEDEYGIEATAECALGKAGTASIATYRHARSKYVPKGACPRIEGDTYWIDGSRVRDAALLRRMASALNAKVLTDCRATTT